MFLEKLTITTHTGNILRDVQFQPGLNLILGISNQDGTTNNIGKTTLIRSIDFCLGGKIEQFYADKENKGLINNEVFDFLSREQPTFTLQFKDLSTNNKYTVLRTLGYVKDKLSIANEKIFLESKEIEGDFSTELKKIFFNNLEKKPTFRQLIPKFLRKDEQQISNVLKYLHSSTSNQEYEKIHLFLFGFNVKAILQQKSDLERKLKSLKNSKEALGSRFNATDLKQILEITKKELEKLFIERDKFQLDDKYEIEEKELKIIQTEILKLEKIISDNELKKTLTLNKLNELNDGIFENDTKALKLIYEEANFYSDELHKTFDEVVEFHNKMIRNEMQYLESKIHEYEQLIFATAKNRSIYTQKYSELMKKLSKTGSLAEYTKLNEQIEKIVEKKGQEEKFLEELGKLEDEIKDIERKLFKIKLDLNSNLEDFDNKLAIFNESFSTYSKQLYDEEYILSYDKDQEPIKFYTKNTGGNQGSGKKQAIISAFDLAYIDFVNKLGLNFPEFVAHDKVELIDINKLKNLFEIANKINGQYIVPIIEDKIEPIVKEFDNNIILELSEKKKFFCI